jgi:hypothetical protein
MICPFENYVVFNLDEEATAYLGNAMQATKQGDFIRVSKPNNVLDRCKIFKQFCECGILVLGHFRADKDVLFFKIYDDDIYLDGLAQRLYVRIY